MNTTYFIDAIREHGYKISLGNGLGNRFNLLLFLSKYNLPFVWELDDNISESYEDIIDFSDVDIDISCKKDDDRVLNMSKYPGFKPYVKDTTLSKFGGWNTKWFSTGVDFNILKNLKPGSKARQLMLDLPESTIGYSIRRYWGKKQPYNLLDVPRDCFLTTDCVEQRKYSSNAIQLHDGGSRTISNITSVVSLSKVVADWFQLRACKKIYALGHASSYTEALCIYKHLDMNMKFNY